MSSSALTKAGEPASRTVPTSRRMPTPCRPSRAWRLGAHRAHTGRRVLDGAHIGEQHALKARADRAHRLVHALRLLDLHHAGEVGELQRAAEIVEFVQVERRVLGGELDIVVLAALAHQFDQRRPGGQKMRPEGGLRRHRAVRGSGCGRMCRPRLCQRGLPSTSFLRSSATGNWKKRANSNTVVSSWFQQT